MGLKHLLVILSCSAVSVSLCVPSRAEIILQNSHFNLESTEIKNKGYGNKQTKQSLVGIWKGVVNQQTDPVVIYVNFKADDTFYQLYQSRNRTEENSGFWLYSNGRYLEYSNGRDAGANVQWVSNDEIIFIITKHSNPNLRGAQIRYYRQQQPVSNSPSRYPSNQQPTEPSNIRIIHPDMYVPVY